MLLHETVTLPVYPLEGVMVTVEVALFPGVTELGFNAVTPRV
jgi:hypothetical protein